MISFRFSGFRVSFFGSQLVPLSSLDSLLPTLRPFLVLYFSGNHLPSVCPAVWTKNTNHTLKFILTLLHAVLNCPTSASLNLFISMTRSQTPSQESIQFALAISCFPTHPVHLIEVLICGSRDWFMKKGKERESVSPPHYPLIVINLSLCICFQSY